MERPESPSMVLSCLDTREIQELHQILYRYLATWVLFAWPKRWARPRGRIMRVISVQCKLTWAFSTKSWQDQLGLRTKRPKSEGAYKHAMTELTNLSICLAKDFTLESLCY